MASELNATASPVFAPQARVQPGRPPSLEIEISLESRLPGRPVLETEARIVFFSGEQRGRRPASAPAASETNATRVQEPSTFTS